MIEEVPRVLAIGIAEIVETAVVATTTAVGTLHVVAAAPTTAGEETNPIVGVGTVGMAEAAVDAVGDGKGVGTEVAGTAADPGRLIHPGATLTMKRSEQRLRTTLTFAG